MELGTQVRILAGLLSIEQSEIDYSDRNCGCWSVRTRWRFHSNPGRAISLEPGRFESLQFDKVRELKLPKTSKSF